MESGQDFRGNQYQGGFSLNSDWVRDLGGQSVQFGDSPSVDPFGNLRVSQRYGVFESKLISNRNDSLWSTRVTGMILVHGAITGPGFQVDEVVSSGAGGPRGTVTAVGSGNITINNIVNVTISGATATVGYPAEWTPGVTITGATSGTTATLTTANTGAYTEHSYYEAAQIMKVGTVFGQRVDRRTLRYFPYIAGYASRGFNTVDLDTPQANLLQQVWIGDDLNGVGFRYNGLTPEVFVLSNTSGSPVYTAKGQTEWNYDRLDGTGPSGVKLDLTKNQISDVSFQWLGVGTVPLALNIDNRSLVVHKFNHANLSEGVYMRTPTLPMSYRLENLGTTTGAQIKQICSSFGSEGGYQIPGFEFTVNIPFSSSRSVTTTRTPVMAIRLKNNYPAGFPNRRTVRLVDAEFIAESNNADIELEHVHYPITISGTPGPDATWTSVDTEDSAVEYTTDITALTAIKRHLILAGKAISSGVSKVGGISLDPSILNYHNYISQNYESNNSQMFVIYAESEAVTASISGHFTWVEFE